MPDTDDSTTTPDQPVTDTTQATGDAGTKGANLADYLEALIHREFTNRADDLFGMGRVTREERIALSNAIGDALDAFHARLQQDDLADVRKRAPYAEATETYERSVDAPAGDPLAAVKIGARNSKVDLARIQGMHDLATDLGAKCPMMRRRDDDEAETPAAGTGDSYPPGDGKEAGTPATGGETSGLVAPAEPAEAPLQSVTWNDATKDATWAVKALGGNRIGGYAVLWGNPAQRDLTREYFTPETADMTSIFVQLGRLPNLYAHGSDGTMKSSLVGVIDTMIADDIGVWYEAQLQRSSAYREAVMRLIQQGLLGSSSGTLPAAREVGPDGHIKRWPIVEVSLTPAPAEYRMLTRPVSEIKEVFEAIGLNFEGEEVLGDKPQDPTDESADQAVAASREIAVELELLALLQV